MDFSYHIRKSESMKVREYPKIEKKCIHCGKALENNGSYLYYQRFCCLECKEAYCGRVLEE